MVMRNLNVFAAIVLLSGSGLLTPFMTAQTKPAIELEGAIAKEQVDGDLKAAIASYQKISSDPSAPRDVRAKALLHLAGCYEKLGQQAKKVYEQIVRDFADQPAAAAQARARLAAYATPATPAPKDLKPKRLTANTPDLTIQAAGISRDGKLIAYSDQLGIHVLVIASGESHLVEGTREQVFVQWMPDGRSVQTQSENERGETSSAIVPVSADAPSTIFLGANTSLSPDGAYEATLSDDGLELAVQPRSGGGSRILWRTLAKGTLDQYSWSPDSKRIAIIRSKKGDNGYQSHSTLEVVDVTKGEAPKVLVSENKKFFIGSVAWASPTSVIFVVNVDTAPNQYESNLWELRLNAGSLVADSLRKLTAWTDFPIRPGSLSAHDHRLVFIRSFRQRDVYVAPLEDGGKRMGTPRRLTLDLSDDYPSDWTHDSKTVIFTSTRIAGTQTIFRQDLDKETAERVFVMPGQQVMARVTPDGGSLLFMNRFPKINPQNHLMIVPIGGGTPQLVPNTPNPGWFYRCSIAGVCIDAQKETEKGPYVLSELDPAKGQGREIYRDAQLKLPDISPDGQWIADTQGTGKNTKIILRSFATGAVVREIPVQGAVNIFTFGYAPDGQGFYCGDISPTQVRELYVDLSGKAFVLYHEPASVWGIWGIPSPDGRHLALVLLTDDSNVYMVDGF